MPNPADAAIVQELYRRRSELAPDQASVVDELMRRMMETGAIRPDVPSAPVPAALREPTNAAARYGMSSFNPRTGRQYTERDVAARVPIIDGPIEGPGQVADGMAAMTDPSMERKAHGVSQVIRGTANIAAPLLPVAAASAPIRVGAAMVTGTAAGLATDKGLEAAGVPEGYRELAGDVTAGLAGGRTVRALTPARTTALTTRAQALPTEARAAVTGVPIDPVAGFTKAVKPGAKNLEFSRALNRALPEMKVTEAELGRPIANVDDAIEAVKLAKRRVRAQYEAIGPRGPNAKINLSPVADMMEKSIPAKLKLENPKEAARLWDIAQKYRREFSLSEAEEFLRTTNAELDAYYHKYPTARRKTAAANPETALLDAQGQGLRSTIYGWLDASGQGAAPRELNQRYGALLNVEEELYRRRNVAASQAPESLSEQASKWHAAGQAVKGGARILTGDIGGVTDIAGAVAQRKAATWIKEQNTTDNLIRNVFANYTRKPLAVRMRALPPPAQ